MSDLPTKRCQRWLATIWFLGAGCFLGLVVLLSLIGRYGERTAEAFGWALPTIMPTLSLIMTVLVADAFQDKTESRVDAFLFRLTTGLSLFYLAAVLLTVLLQPFSGKSPLQLFEMSNLWLGPLQGIVAGAMGVFFTRSESTNEEASE